MKKITKGLLCSVPLLAVGKLQAEAQDLSSLYTPNLFLGTVDVRIPLYDQNGIGASLSYNTKGDRKSVV